MAPLKKRKTQPKPDENSGDSDSQSSDVGIGNDNQIQATFEGRNLEEFDFHGIKQLLQQVFLKAHIDTSQMTDLLVNQHGIGSVLKQAIEDEDESDSEDDDMNQVFGVTTVLNLTSHKETPCVQQLLGLIKEQVIKHGDDDTQKKFQEVVGSNKKLGLLINERFLNIPATISAPMLSSLHEEIKRVKKRDASYEFQNFIMICKTFKMKKEMGESSFSNDEECIFSTYADCSFEFDVSKESDTAIGGQWGQKEEEIVPFRRVLLFSGNKLENIISQVTSFVQA